MEHVKLTKGKHVIIFTLNKSLPNELVEDISNKLHGLLGDEFTHLVTQGDVTVLSVED